MRRQKGSKWRLQESAASFSAALVGQKGQNPALVAAGGLDQTAVGVAKSPSSSCRLQKGGEGRAGEGGSGSRQRARVGAERGMLRRPLMRQRRLSSPVLISPPGEGEEVPRGQETPSAGESAHHGQQTQQRREEAKRGERRKKTHRNTNTQHGSEARQKTFRPERNGRRRGQETPCPGAQLVTAGGVLERRKGTQTHTDSTTSKGSAALFSSHPPVKGRRCRGGRRPPVRARVLITASKRGCVVLERSVDTTQHTSHHTAREAPSVSQ